MYEISNIYSDRYYASASADSTATLKWRTTVASVIKRNRSARPKSLRRRSPSRLTRKPRNRKTKLSDSEEKKKEEEANKPVQENKRVCWVVGCGKKVGLTALMCRCGYFFCNAHRLPESHNCTFDYQTEGRELLAKRNEKVVGSTLEKS